MLSTAGSTFFQQVQALGPECEAGITERLGKTIPTSSHPVRENKRPTSIYVSFMAGQGCWCHEPHKEEAANSEMSGSIIQENLRQAPRTGISRRKTSGAGSEKSKGKKEEVKADREAVEKEMQTAQTYSKMSHGSQEKSKVKPRRNSLTDHNKRTWHVKHSPCLH